MFQICHNDDAFLHPAMLGEKCSEQMPHQKSGVQCCVPMAHKTASDRSVPVIHWNLAAAESLSKDVALCAEHMDISNTAKCVVANSLQDSAASYLNTVYKTEKNLVLFMQALDKISTRKWMNRHGNLRVGRSFLC